MNAETKATCRRPGLTRAPAAAQRWPRLDVRKAVWVVVVALALGAALACVVWA